MPTKEVEFPKQLREQEVAEILNVSRAKLRKDRMEGVGVPFKKYGKSVRYDSSQLAAYMAGQDALMVASK
jgi:hypothetical protein